MKLPPLWKIKREVVRFGQQIKSAPRDVVMLLFSTPYYDLVLSRKRTNWTG